MELILFELFDETYALPASCVREVAPTVPVTPLPFVDRVVDGLVGLAGSVVTQINLAARLGLENSLDEGDGVLLLVEIKGVLHALHIHRMVGLVRTSEEEIHATQATEEDEHAPPIDQGPAIPHLLIGEFTWKERTVLLLDASQIGIPDFIQTGSGGVENGLLAGQEEQRSQIDHGFPCLVMASGGGHYALRLSQVREVLEAGRITALPHAPREVAGITFLRHTPYLVLSLNRLLGTDHGETEHVLVLVQEQEWTLGLLVEKLSGIQRFQEQCLHPVSADETELECYLRGKNEEMIGLLHPPGLFSEERLNQWKHFLPASHHTGEGQGGKHTTTRSFLACLSGEERCLIPLGLVERVTEFKSFDPLPGHDNPYLVGVVQLHGEVLPVSDLRLMLNQGGQSDPSAYVVIRMGEEAWAVTVDRLFRVVEVPEERIEGVGNETGTLVQAVGRLNDQIYSVLGFELLAKAA